MSDILHQFPIRSSPSRVFEAVTTPGGLDSWWTLQSNGKARLGEVYELGFGPGYDWRGEVTRCIPDRQFEWTMVQAMDDWQGTRVGVTLAEQESGLTLVEFYHTGWAEASGHYRTSNCCWAMYLRILRRYVEFGEQVPYDLRLEV